MKNKLIGLSLLGFLLVMPLIAAAITVESPIANSNHTGTMDIVVEYTNGTDMTDALAVNTTCDYNASGTVVTVGTLTSFIYNGVNGINATIDVSALTDSEGLSFNCSVGNDTDFVLSDTIDQITFDSTDPVLTYTVELDGEFQSLGRGVDYSCTTADAIDSSPTETFAVAHPSGDSPATTSLTLQSTKLFFEDTDYAGDYLFTCTSTDYTGNVVTSSKTVTVDSTGNLIVSSNGSSNNTWVWVILGLLAVWLISNAKKK